MKRLNHQMRLIFITLLINVGNACVFGEIPLAPDHLRCMDIMSPVGTEAKPYFGWYVNDPDDNEVQTAYQILVSSSLELLQKDIGDLWDSKKVNSSGQNYIYYEGKPLSISTKYFWKVRTWDKDDESGPFSGTGTFTTGLFENLDWSGSRWIKRDGDEDDDYTYFRKNIMISGNKVKQAVLFISVCHDYELYINEKLIGKGPAYHYPQYQYYNAFDVTDVLSEKSGNVLACLTHWYGGGQGRPKGSKGLLIKLMVRYDDGSVETFGTDQSWKQKRADQWISGQKRRNGEGIGYIDFIDSRKVDAGWNKMNYDDKNWSPAIEIGEHPTTPWNGILQPDLTRIIENEIKPVAVNEISEGFFVIDRF